MKNKKLEKYRKKLIALSAIATISVAASGCDSYNSIPYDIKSLDQTNNISAGEIINSLKSDTEYKINEKYDFVDDVLSQIGKIALLKVGIYNDNNELEYGFIDPFTREEIIKIGYTELKSFNYYIDNEYKAFMAVFYKNGEIDILDIDTLKLERRIIKDDEEIIENQNNTIISLEQEKASLEQEKANLQEQLNKLKETPEPETASENLNSDNINDLSSDGAVQLFYENGVLKVDSIGQPYYLQYYDDYYGGPDDNGERDGYVQEIVKNGKKYLVDANDFSKVLLSDYESLGEPRYLKYYDHENGGPDENNYSCNHNGDGYVQEIVKNGKKYLVDANDFSKVLLSDYESLGEPKYLKYYDCENGGTDKNNFRCNHNGDGYVQEIIKNGKKYLVDANNFSLVLASDYTLIDQNNLNTTILFADGHTEVYANKDFKPNKSYVLTK